MRGRLIRWRLAGIGVFALICPFVGPVSGFGAESEQPPGRFVFELDEVSAFELDSRVVLFFTRGQCSFCSEERADEVKVYPTFKSDKPLYGSVEFRSEYDGELPRTKYYFALDESAGTGGGYDRFYFDLNRDFDLTNDCSLSVHKNPPNNIQLKNTRKPQWTLQETTFEYLELPFEFGNEGVQPLEVLPCLVVRKYISSMMRFVNPRARKSKIELGGHRHDVFLGHDHAIAGWYNRPLTALHLIPEGKPYRTTWRDADRLMAVHKIGGTFYRFSATPKGDKLTAQEYKGPFGTFEIRLGRDIQAGMITTSGSLRSREMAVAVGGPKCHLPVGDYLPSYLTINLVDQMIVSLSDNCHIDGESYGAENNRKNYGIKIREGKSYVLDFASKPDVMFTSPAKDHRIRPGEELRVETVLIDPELDLMIRDLDEIVRPRSANGKEGNIGKCVSLDPKVIITRTNSEKLAEGVMPFG